MLVPLTVSVWRFLPRRKIVRRKFVTTLNDVELMILVYNYSYKTWRINTEQQGRDNSNSNTDNNDSKWQQRQGERRLEEKQEAKHWAQNRLMENLRRGKSLEVLLRSLVFNAQATISGRNTIHHLREWRLKTTLYTSDIQISYSIRISVVLHLFAHSYVAVLNAKFAEKWQFVLSSLD